MTMARNATALLLLCTSALYPIDEVPYFQRVERLETMPHPFSGAPQPLTPPLHIPQLIDTDYGGYQRQGLQSPVHASGLDLHPSYQPTTP